MASINRVTLIGNLGRDPERVTTSGGHAFAKFSVATNENYQDRSGQWQTLTEWHTVKVWGPSADRVMQQLRKGSLVYIEGSLRSYEVGENSRRLWEVKALTWRSLDPKERQGDKGYSQGGGGEDQANSERGRGNSRPAPATPSAEGEAPCAWGGEETVI